jgi:archaellum component FlaF (FlaF/FlaG flagellin family)
VIPIHKIKKLICLILIIAFLYPVKASTLDLTIEFFKNDTALLKEWYFTTENFATFLPFQGSGDYQVKILDKNGTVLFSEKFNILFLLQINQENDIITKELNSSIANFRLYLPPKSFSVRVYKKEKEILSLNLSEIICNGNKICEREKGEDEYLCPNECLVVVQKTVCGNKICETGETQENCCKDCGCPSGYKCIENKCVKTSSPPIYIIFALIIAILVAVVILQSKKFHTQS